MKKVVLSFIFTTGLFGLLNAQEYKIPDKVVVITRQDVNIRQAPQTSAAVVEKASMGTMYELTGQKDSWYEVKDIKTGKNVYVSTTVGRLATGNQISRTDKGLVSEDEYPDIVYQKLKDAERRTDDVLRILSETGKRHRLRQGIANNRYYDGKHVYPGNLL